MNPPRPRTTLLVAGLLILPAMASAGSHHHHGHHDTNVHYSGNTSIETDRGDRKVLRRFHAERGLKAGMDHYLSKPFTSTQLASALALVTDSAFCPLG